MRALKVLFFSFSFVYGHSQNVDSLLVNVDSTSFWVQSPNVILLEHDVIHETKELLSSENELYLTFENKSDIGKITYGIIAFREYKLGVYPPNDPLVTFSQSENKKLVFEIDYGRMPREWQKWFFWFLNLHTEVPLKTH